MGGRRGGYRAFVGKPEGKRGGAHTGLLWVNLKASEEGRIQGFCG
jgi:hypothetical protein